MKKLLSILLTLILCISIMTPSVTYAATIKLNKSKLELNLGDTYTLKLKGSSGTVKWSSSDKSIATVSKKGKVSAIAIGKTTVTATINKKKYKCSVTVSEKVAKVVLPYFNYDDAPIEEYIDDFKEEYPDYLAVEKYNEEYIIVTMKESDRQAMLKECEDAIDEMITEFYSDSSEMFTDISYDDSFSNIMVYVNADEYDSFSGSMLAYIFYFLSDYYQALQLIEVDDRTFSVQFINNETSDVLDQYDMSALKEMNFLDSL